MAKLRRQLLLKTGRKTQYFVCPYQIALDFFTGHWGPQQNIEEFNTLPENIFSLQ